ncbi:MAG: EscU/YscU/HrcU family type III secretion system export apparatus switch protein [Selenomonadaceae bacterium]|nr:EscU/YscU/HrcU family type III secretion system export apparatus switch protein [Selenomonadaceae bacterium]
MDEEYQKTPEEILAEQKAVALKYDMQTDVAPRVIAKGKGHVAEHILATAQKNSIPVYQNKTLVNMLMALEIDREIPPELYKAIAEVMAYVYKMDKEKGHENALKGLQRGGRPLI